MFLQDCPEIADFFTELVDAVGDVSLQLQGDDTVQVVEGMVHPYKGTAWALQPLSWGRCGQGGRASRGNHASLQRYGLGSSASQAGGSEGTPLVALPWV